MKQKTTKGKTTFNTRTTFNTLKLSKQQKAVIAASLKEIAAALERGDKLKIVLKILIHYKDPAMTHASVDRVISK